MYTELYSNRHCTVYKCTAYNTYRMSGRLLGGGGGEDMREMFASF